MKILVTGSSGFVGKHLVKLLSKKHDVVKYDLVENQDILEESKLLKKMEDVDIVVNLAAFISAPESWEKPKEYIINNSIGTLSVVKTAIKAGIKRMIHFSSAAVKTKPLTPYAVSKRMSEDILDLYKDKIKITIVRPENIYGTGQKTAYGYVINNFINAIKNNLAVKIYGDGKQIRDFIYVEDVVSVVDKIIENDIYGKTISVGLGKGVSINNLSKIIAKILNKEISIEYLEKRDEPRVSFSDTKVLKSIGILPNNFTRLEDGIKKLI